SLIGNCSAVEPHLGPAGTVIVHSSTSMILCARSMRRSPISRISTETRHTLGAMWQPGALSRTALALIWLVLGLAMIAVPVWLGWTRWPALLNGHPAMLVAGIACGLLGFIAVAWSIGSLTIGDRQDREGSGHPAHRTSKQVLRRAHLRIIFAVPALVLALLLVVVLAYARPFVATPTATAALRSGNGVRLADRLGWYEAIPPPPGPSGGRVRPTAWAAVFPRR